MNPNILSTILQLAVILIIANIVRPLCLKMKVPPVIGLITTGIILGPSLLHFADKTPTIRWIAEVGVLFLIFSAGIETDLNRLQKESQKAVFPAVGGVVLPFISGFVLSYIFGYGLISSLIIGTIFTATSISISLMTLLEINKWNSVEGRCIVNSAIIDDILGIILISLVFSLSLGKETSPIALIQTMGISITKILLFFLISYVAGRYIILMIFANCKKLNLEGSILSLAIAMIFVYAWLADLMGLAAITGAFVCGLILGRTKYKESLFTEVTNLGRSFFIDIFFVGIGLGLSLKTLSFKPMYQILFVLLAILSKIIGSSLGALITRFDLTRSLRIGIGMVPRGEVALILSSMAYQRDLIDVDILSTTIIMVIITSILSPILLKNSFTLTRKKTFRLKN